MASRLFVGGELDKSFCLYLMMKWRGAAFRPLPATPSGRVFLGPHHPTVLDKGPDPPAIILTQFLDHFVQVLFFVLFRLSMCGFLFAQEFLMLDGDTLRPLNGHPIVHIRGGEMGQSRQHSLGTYPISHLHVV